MGCEQGSDSGRIAIGQNLHHIAFLKRLGDDEIYLTFDIDCIDPGYAPGTGTPSIGGFTSAQALALVRALRGINLVGGDVVEVLPDRDPIGITALLAAHIMFEIICLIADTIGE